MKQFLKTQFKRDSIIGSSRDTGYGIYKLFNKNQRFECVQPVFTKNLPPIKPAYIRSFFNEMIEKFLPDRWCYLPSKHGYFSKKSFSDLGYNGVLSYNWDEFIWKDEPFGFHMQGAKKDGTTNNHLDDMPKLRDVLDYYLNLHK